eukprot:11991546-Karenia_brevis.AAC.1
MALDLPTPRSHVSEDHAHGAGPPDPAIVAQFKEQLKKALTEEQSMAASASSEGSVPCLALAGARA